MRIPEKKVKELIALMNSMSTASIPAQRPIIEMFNIAMDEQMVDYLLKLGTKHYTVEGLKKVYEEMYGCNEESWTLFYKELMEMSFVHPKSNQERHLYHVSPIFPGWVEFATGGPLNEKREAILDKFMEFWGILKTVNIAPVRFIKNMRGVKKVERGDSPRVSTYVSKGREINLNQALTSEQVVFPAGDIYKLLEKNKDEIAVMNCFCRQHKAIHEGGSCDFDLPLEGCVSLGAVSRQLVENGVARHVPYEEALALMDEFQRKGAIHTTFHYGNDAKNQEELIICNCCIDCCLLYKGYREGGLSNIFTRSYYSPKMIDINKCVGCNICGKYCPTEATYYDRQAKKLIFDYQKCIGCGQCVNQCKFNVREMIKDERPVFVKTKKRPK